MIFIYMEKKILLEILTKKVSEKIIKERKSDELSLQISRLIINQFKKKEDFVYDGLYFERGDEYASFDLKVSFIENKNLEEPFSVHAEADMQEMEIEITYKPSSFPRNMNDLVAEVKETIEHELEHIEQQNFEDMYTSDDEYHEDNNLKYLTSKTEIPAYVRGLIKRSKTKKISLEDAMEEWFNENKKKFDNPKKEWKKVKKIWLDYANDMRKTQRVKKFK